VSSSFGPGRSQDLSWISSIDPVLSFIMGCQV
jgi:hypothetical protein